MKKLFRDKFGNIKLSGLNSPFFIIGLTIKLLLSFSFASDYIYKLFVPFVDFFVTNNFANPYEHFYNSGISNAFPYPALMLWLLATSKLIFSWINYGADIWTDNIDLLIYRIPILIADFCILIILMRWLKTHQEEVILFYWLSPVLLYINYINGQFDAIPTAFLFIAMYFLFKERDLFAFISIGLALACKTHILLVLPFFVFHLIKSRQASIIRVALCLVSSLLTFLLLNLNFISSTGFQQMVFTNSQQIKLFDFAVNFPNNISFYIIPALYIALLIHSLSFKIFNKDVFVMFLGFSYGLLIIFIPPMQGWYYWVLPQFIYFHIRHRDASISKFIILNFLYFTYFLLHPESDYLQVFQPSFTAIASKPNLYNMLNLYGVNVNLLFNLVFTSLQVFLFYNCIWMYKEGIKSNLSSKIKSEPYLIAVSGDSGSGKTTYSNLLIDIFGKQDCTVIHGDDMHKYERSDEMWKTYTHLNPKANLLHDDIQHALLLKQGSHIKRRHYNHQTGKFDNAKKVRSGKIIIFEGLHTLYLNSAQKTYDIKVFINPEENIRINWKINRDVKERSKTEQDVIEQINQRKEDSNKYIQTQSKNADLIISFKKNIQNDEILEIECDNSINLSSLILSLSQSSNLSINHLYEDEKQKLIFDGQINKELIDFIAYDLITELDDNFAALPKWHDNYNGILQIFTLYYIFEQLRLSNLKAKVGTSGRS